MEHTCPICFEPCGSPERFAFACGHAACRPCVGGYVAAEAEAGRLPLRCFVPACRAEAGNALFLEFLEGEALERAHRLELERAIAGDARFATCPAPDCPGVVELAEGEREFACPVCAQRSCAGCRGSAHAGACAEGLPEDVAAYVGRVLAQRCPECRMLVEKTDGCNEMTCRCGRKFCYLCGEGLDAPGHFRSGHGQFDDPGRARPGHGQFDDPGRAEARAGPRLRGDYAGRTVITSDPIEVVGGVPTFEMISYPTMSIPEGEASAQLIGLDLGISLEGIAEGEDAVEACMRRYGEPLAARTQATPRDDEAPAAEARAGPRLRGGFVGGSPIRFPALNRDQPYVTPCAGRFEVWPESTTHWSLANRDAVVIAADAFRDFLLWAEERGRRDAKAPAAEARAGPRLRGGFVGGSPIRGPVLNEDQPCLCVVPFAGRSIAWPVSGQQETNSDAADIDANVMRDFVSRAEERGQQEAEAAERGAPARAPRAFHEELFEIPADVMKDFIPRAEERGRQEAEAAERDDPARAPRFPRGARRKSH